MTKTVEFMGGPKHGQLMALLNPTRFLEFPFLGMDSIGLHRYEIVGSLALYVESLA
jgi:hypothetical protein